MLLIFLLVKNVSETDKWYLLGLALGRRQNQVFIRNAQTLEVRTSFILFCLISRGGIELAANADSHGKIQWIKQMGDCGVAAVFSWNT